MTKKKDLPERKFGKRTGYDVLPDGKFRVAPMHTDALRTLVEREDGLRELLNTTNKFVAEELTRISKARREFWTNLTDDIGIETVPGWSLDFNTRILSPPPPPEEKKNDREG